MVKNLLMEVSPIDPATGNYVTLRLSTSGVQAPATILDGGFWYPLITSRPTFDIKLTNSGQLAPIEISYGTLSFNMSSVFGNDIWSTYIWNGALGRLFWGDEGQEFGDYQQIFEGQVSNLERDGFTATVALLGTEADLNRPLLYDAYDGTGGAEGPATLKGKLKPWCSGYAFNVSPVLVDPALWIYQVHGYGPIHDIPFVYEFAQKLSAPTYSVNSYAELAALTLAPGQWAKATPVGMFRLGGQPAQKLTCDVEGAKEAPDSFTGDISRIIAHLVAVVAPAALFGSLAAFDGKYWGIFSDSQITVGDVVRSAALDAGGYIFPDGAGVWQIGDFYHPHNTGTLSSERDSLPLVVDGGIKELVSAGPVYKVRVGYARCWSTHTDAEISPAISADTITDLTEQLENLDEVVATSAEAINRLDAMAADNVLSRAEKKLAAQQFATETTDKLNYVTAASDFDVITEQLAYSAAYDALAAYLTGLTPAWNDTSHDTPIDRAVWNSKWQDLYKYKTLLLQVMTGQASQMARWDLVTGDGKPEDNATNGAPDGTYVGGVPAEVIADNATHAAMDAARLLRMMDDLMVNATSTISAAFVEAKRIEEAADAEFVIVKSSHEELKAEFETGAGGALAKIEEEKEARLSGDAANASATSTLTSTVSGVAATVTTQGNTLVTQGNSLSSLTTTVSSQGTTLSGLSSTVSTQGSTLTTQGTALANLTTTVTSQGTTLSGLSATVSTQGTTLTNQGTSIATLTSTVNSQGTTLTGLSATVTTQGTTITTQGATLASLSSTVSTQGATVTSNSSAITTLNGNVSSINGSLTSLNGTVGSLNTSVGNLNGNMTSVLAKNGVTLDVNGYVTGYQQLNNGTSGSFTISADYFAIVKPGGGARLQWLNGALKVIDGSGITRVHIGDLSV